MITTAVHFRCPHCRSRIKAPAQLIGQSRSCPGCKQSFAVPRLMSEDAGPVLVPIENADRYTLAIVPRRHAVNPQARRPYPSPKAAYAESACVA
jgi:hypothetical protein